MPLSTVTTLLSDPQGVEYVRAPLDDRPHDREATMMEYDTRVTYRDQAEKDHVREMWPGWASENDDDMTGARADRLAYEHVPSWSTDEGRRCLLNRLVCRGGCTWN